MAPELPAKTEQTIYCELEPAQRKLYDELRQHYRDALLQRDRDRGLGQVEDPGAGGAAAAAPGRLPSRACSTKARRAKPAPSWTCCWSNCAKCSRKATRRWSSRSSPACWPLSASAWTPTGTVYEYLDGQRATGRRASSASRTMPDCRLFLISLKAGGLGLNLTAAEYVFLLDPWWNPAVEAQAIDRAHRIGQTRQVFAYRLIARDTVEEKVLELQKTKRDLADAIIGEDNSLIRNLRREDLELLLS